MIPVAILSIRELTIMKNIGINRLPLIDKNLET